MTAPSPTPLPTRPTPVPVAVFPDARGSLGVIETPTMPFAAERLYFLFDLKRGVVRGEHAHKALRQVILCLAGAADVMFWDGEAEQVFTLTDRATGIYVPAGFWREITPREDGSVLAILASDPYDPDDYIFDKAEFRAWRAQGQEGGA